MVMAKKNTLDRMGSRINMSAIGVVKWKMSDELRIVAINVETMNDKEREVADTLARRRVKIFYIHISMKYIHAVSMKCSSQEKDLE